MYTCRKSLGSGTMTSKQPSIAFKSVENNNKQFQGLSFMCNA